jgi:hypothetical protein
MKYDEKYKKVDQNWLNGGMFKGTEEWICATCGECTLWVEPTFQAPVCSDECYKSLWDEYIELTKMGAGIIMD